MCILLICNANSTDKVYYFQLCAVDKTSGNSSKVEYIPCDCVSIEIENL